MNNCLTNINIRPTSSRFSKCLINIDTRSLPPSSPPHLSLDSASHTLTLGVYFLCFYPQGTEAPFTNKAPREWHCITATAWWSRTVWTKGSLIVLNSFSGGWDTETAEDYVRIQKRPRKLIHLIQSFENSVQTSLRVL